MNKILDINIDGTSKHNVLQKIYEYLHDGLQHWIATVNPEIVLRARKDKDYRDVLNSADLRVADGMGIIFASWFLGDKIKERVIGVDLVEDILDFLSLRAQSRRRRDKRGNLTGGAERRSVTDNGIASSSPPKARSPRNDMVKVMITGAGRGSRKKAGEKLREKFPDIDLKISEVEINIKNKNKEELLRLNKEIKDFRPAILFVAFGAPYQEKWIYGSIKLLPTVKLAIGVGGAIDMISGKLPRAPRFMRKIGFEWLWRLFLEPKRIGRIFRAVFVFPALIILSRLNSE